MEQIKDLEKYNNDMEKSLQDKLFFLDKVEGVERIVDFGCANGALLAAAPNTWYKVGVDNNAAMRAECAKKGIYSLSDLGAVRPQSHTLLNMSSVIHEVYSYLSDEEVSQFWNEVFSGKYEYITIRDMMVNDFVKHATADPTHMSHFHEDGKFYNEYAASFVKHWCPIGTPNLISYYHYLLKYKYTENWDREVIENYLPITVEDLKILIPDNYEIVYEEEYILPYLKEQLKKDFNYDIKYNTHIKLVLKKKN